MRGVSFVEDLEQYRGLSKERQKAAKVRVTFFGEQAQTLVGLSAAQVVTAEKDLWWYQVLFLVVNMRAKFLFGWTIVCIMSDFWFLIYKLLCSSCNGNFSQSMTLLLRRARGKEILTRRRSLR